MSSMIKIVFDSNSTFCRVASRVLCQASVVRVPCQGMGDGGYEPTMIDLL